MIGLVGPPRTRRGGPTGVSGSGSPAAPPFLGRPVDHGKDRSIVLPRPRRVNRPADFRRVLRRGRKCGRRRLVVHAHLGTTAQGASDAAAGPPPARAGLVVGRGVGPAVVRHRVSRRLRHLLASRLDLVAPGTDLVIRAQAPAAEATSSELADDLDAALRRLGLVEGAR